MEREARMALLEADCLRLNQELERARETCEECRAALMDLQGQEPSERKKYSQLEFTIKFKLDEDYERLEVIKEELFWAEWRKEQFEKEQEPLSPRIKSQVSGFFAACSYWEQKPMDCTCSHKELLATIKDVDLQPVEEKVIEVPIQTASDLNEIKKLEQKNPTMKWESSRQYSLTFCTRKRISLPTFSDPAVQVSITVDDEIEFIRLPMDSNSYAVLGNSEHGKVVGVFKGDIIF
jgi:hypothetical protein